MLEEERELEGSPDEGFARRLVPLMETLASQGRYLARLAVRAGERIRVLEVDEIDWISVERERVFVHAGDESFRVRRTLAELESRLDPSHFFRAHRATIVNLSRVREIVPWFKGSHRLRLTTGAEVELSRAQARALRRILGW